MSPAEELADLIARGIALADRFPDHREFAAAIARFTAPPDLRRLNATSPRVGVVRAHLPLEGRSNRSRPPTVAIATPDIVGPIRNGGIGTAYTSLAAALAAAGHDVTILYTLGDYCENGAIDDWTDHYRSRGIRFVPIPDPDGPRQIHGPRHSYSAYRWLSTRAFDVVHFPEWGGTAFCSVQAKRLGLAFNTTQICVGLHSPTLWHDLEDRRTVNRIDQLETDFLERRSVEWADVVVSPSQYLLQWLDRWGWTTPDRTYVQPYVAEALPRRHAFGERVPVTELVFFGRLESRKGLELFCDAVDRLPNEPLPNDFKITFLGKSGHAGGGDGLHYVRERAAAWPRPWHAIVDFSRQQALEYLSSRPALAVMPSLADNTPNTVLECVQAGLPFIATTTGGIPEMILQEDREHSLVLPNAVMLASAMAQRLALGALVVRPAADPDAVRRRWIEWHEEQASVTHKSVAESTSMARDVDSNTGPPLVSVCMATHDRPIFLEQALDSIRRQTYHNFEVVLIDDGSETREAADQLNSIAPEFDRRGWKVLRGSRKFPGAARNAAAAAAQGRYILFMDDDNVARPEEIETFVRSAQYSGAAILTCAHDAFEGTEPPASAAQMRHTWLPFGGALPLALLVNCVGDTNMLVRREAFFAVGGFDEERGAGLVEDWTFFGKAMVRGMRIEVVPESLYLYRLGPHGFGQRSSSLESYARSLRPFIDALPNELGLALLYAAGAHRSSLGEGRAALAIDSSRNSRPRLRDRVYTWLLASLNPSNAGSEEGDHLAEGFAGAPSVAAFGPEPASSVIPIHQAQVTRTDSVLRVLSLGNEPQLALDCSRVIPLTQGPLLVRLDITTAKDTVAQLFWKTPNVPLYCEQQSVRTCLAPGRNIRYLRIPARTIVGRLRFDPATYAGELTVQSLQIRREIEPAERRRP